MPFFTARSIKATIPLDPAELRYDPPLGQARVMLSIRLPDRTITADIASKALRKAVALVQEHGPEGCVAFLQGKLQGEQLIEAGLVAQPKVPKVAQAA